jgi:hypothetical protein
VSWKPTEAGQRFRARFNPLKFATLRPEVSGFVGLTADFVASWLITPEDSGPYVGQWACHLVDRQYIAIFPWWVPWEDLTDIEPIDMPRFVWGAHRRIDDAPKPTTFTPEEQAATTQPATMQVYRFDVGKKPPTLTKARPYSHLVRVNISRRDAIDVMRTMLNQMTRADEPIGVTLFGELAEEDPEG